MATKQLGILKALQAIARAAVAAAVPVTIGKTRAVSAEDASAINLNLGSSGQVGSADGATLGRTNWVTFVEVEIYARAAGDVSGMEAGDPLLEAIYTAALADHTLGGLALDVNPIEGDTLRWEPDQQQENLCRCTLRFAVLHQTAERSISTT